MTVAGYLTLLSYLIMESSSDAALKLEKASSTFEGNVDVWVQKKNIRSTLRNSFRTRTLQFTALVFDTRHWFLSNSFGTPHTSVLLAKSCKYMSFRKSSWICWVISSPSNEAGELVHWFQMKLTDQSLITGTKMRILLPNLLNKVLLLVVSINILKAFCGTIQLTSFN